MMHALTHLDLSWLEKTIRTVAVYAALAVLLRMAGKRDLAQLNTFDLVVMLLLSNMLQNAVIGDDNSLVGGLFAAALLVAVNALVVRATAANRLLERIFEGTPTVLVDNGRYVDSALRREGLRRADVAAAIRRQGANDETTVERATLDVGGTVVVELKAEAQPATKADVAALAVALERLESRLLPRRS
ncbi:MAG TPA: YetF domain-containing protein [Mycobacteriales bacterium]|nr:YetF domain-containing protein [Mycobacteriales bacterium]